MLEDNNAQQSEHYTSPKLVEPDFDEVADMAAVGPQLLVQMSEQEIRQFIDAYPDGNDPLHDWIGYWVKSSPAWNDWNTAAAGVLKYYLALEDQLQLRHISDMITKISNGDLVTILGVTTPQVGDIRGDIQVAVNTQASLSAYERWYDEDGNLVQ